MRNACHECAVGTCRWWCRYCLRHHPVASMVADCERKLATLTSRTA